MAVILYKNGDNTSSALVELVADTPEDIADLDTSYLPGSTCLVTSNSSVYMLSPDGVWREL